jgi:erythromycin esterase
MKNALRFLFLFKVITLFSSCLIQKVHAQTPSSNRSENHPNAFHLDSSNFHFLHSILDSKEILFLGESSHTVHEFNQIRVSLIDYLSHTLQFNTLAIESSLSNCYVVNQLRATLTEKEGISISLFKVYQTEELIPLFRFLKYNSTFNLVGIDNQENRLDTTLVTPWISNEIMKSNPKLATDYRSFITSFKTQTSIFPIGQKDFYYQRGDSLLNILSLWNKDVLNLKGEHAAFLKAHFQNLTYTLIQYSKRTEREGIAFRDSCMASNIIFIKEKLYPDSKLIVWGHNVHIAKDNPIKSYPESAGRMVKEAYPNKTYHIGLYGGSGQTANLTIKKPKKGSLNHLLSIEPNTPFFLCLPQQEWAHSIWKMTYMGYYKEEIVPIKNYDALIYFNIFQPCKKLE